MTVHPDREYHIDMGESAVVPLATTAKQAKQAVLQKYTEQCHTAVHSKIEARDQTEANCTTKQSLCSIIKQKDLNHKN